MKIINQINETNNKKTKDITKILDTKKKYKVDFFKSNNHKLMGIYDNNKLIIGGDYHFYGIYQPNTKLWIWASSIPGIHSKHIKQIRKIKSSDHLFESDSDIKINFYYQLLTQDVLLIDNENMLNWVNELLLFLSNDIYYFNPVNSEGNIQFLTITNIKQKYN